MKIEINPLVLAELQYMVKLHQQYGAPNQFDTVEGLVAYVLASVADGSRRPGAWERGMLDMMGLVADCDEHHMYRSTYGEPGEGAQ
ncbi:hypothetical protein D9M70_411080 [compost metagenome]